MINASKKIMIVDDSPDIRNLVSLILMKQGYEVIEAENGKDALNKLNPAGIEMIITDLRMPVMDGFEFIKHLRNKVAYKSVPVVLLTGESLEFVKGGQTVADECITKPFIPKQLADVIRKFTAR